MPNLKITCVDDGNEFIFTESEQAFFAKNNYVTPKRCPMHRKIRREEIEKKRREEENGR